jgi:hypothetical protein
MRNNQYILGLFCISADENVNKYCKGQQSVEHSPARAGLPNPATMPHHGLDLAIQAERKLFRMLLTLQKVNKYAWIKKYGYPTYKLDSHITNKRFLNLGLWVSKHIVTSKCI